MPNPHQLYKHQSDFLSQNPDKTALVWSCGTGKTRTACEWARLYGSPVLIICPKALKANWERECDKWGLSRLVIMKALIVTKEEFRRDHAMLPPCGQVIVDEVHNGFLTPNFKSQMSKALKTYLSRHKVPRVMLLSATVYTSSPWNIFSLAHYLGREWNWLKFKFAFFNDVKMGRRTVPVAKAGSEARLANIVKKIASVVDIHDCMDVPPQQHLDPEYFALSAKQIAGIKKHYDPLPIVRYTSQHEIENGIWLGNEFAPREEYDADKHERILDLIAENKKIAIVCRYNAQIALLSSLIAKADLGSYLFVIQGATKDRDAVTLAAEGADRCIVLIQADCAEGYQLPSFELCVFASMSYSYVKWVQICGRFLRMDKPSRTTFMYLITEGDSIDQAVYNAIKKKEDFDISLYSRDN